MAQLEASLPGPSWGTRRAPPDLWSFGTIVNELIRRGLGTRRPRRTPYKQRSRRLGLRLDVTDVADALEILEGSDAR